MNRAEWTRRMVLGGLVLLAITSVIHVFPRLACADEASEKKGAALMDKFVEVTGGKAAYEAIKSRIVKGQHTMPGGMVGKLEVYAVYPNKFRSIVELPARALERGSDGETVWVIDPIGAKILAGSERVLCLRESTQDRFGRWRNVFQKAEYIGDEKVNGTTCSKVVLTYKPIDPTIKELPVTVFIGEKSGLIVKWTHQMATSESTAEVTTYFDDFRKVSAVGVPHEVRIEVKTEVKGTVKVEESIVKYDEIVFNVEIPAEKFTLPGVIKKQRENSKEK